MLSLISRKKLGGKGLIFNLSDLCCCYTSLSSYHLTYDRKQIFGCIYCLSVFDTGNHPHSSTVSIFSRFMGKHPGYWVLPRLGRCLCPLEGTQNAGLGQLLEKGLKSKICASRNWLSCWTESQQRDFTCSVGAWWEREGGY